MTIEKLLNTQMLSNAHEVCLHRFCDPDIEWMKSPFSINGQCYSTNAYYIFMAPAGVGQYKPLVDKPLEMFEKACIHEETLKKTISISELVEIIKTAELIEGIKIIEKTIKCPACDGDGEVEFDFNHGHKYYHMDGECPVCEGNCEIDDDVEEKTGEMVINEYNQIRIGNSFFYVRMIIKLIETALTIGVDSIELCYENERRCSVFKIGDAKLLMMPMIEPVKVIGEIKH